MGTRLFPAPRGAALRKLHRRASLITTSPGAELVARRDGAPSTPTSCSRCASAGVANCSHRGLRRLRHMLMHQADLRPGSAVREGAHILARNIGAARLWLATEEGLQGDHARGVHFTDRVGGGRRLGQDAPILRTSAARHEVRYASHRRISPTGLQRRRPLCLRGKRPPRHEGRLKAALAAGGGPMPPEHCRPSPHCARPAGQGRTEILNWWR